MSRILNKIYLDHASATPVALEVKKAMQSFLSLHFGNPSSLHSIGRTAKLALENSRQVVSDILNCQKKEIFFTAGGTESVNLAVLGTVRAFPKGSHIITTAIEHDCVLNSFLQLKKEGYKVSFLPVDSEGFLNLEILKNAVLNNTVFVSVIYGNNEIGSIQPIVEIGKLIRNINLNRKIKNQKEIIFHTDACQVPGACDLNVQNLGVDLLSLNASKIYGPKQVGVLFKRAHVKIQPLLFGGGQEAGLRNGTENVAGAVGMAKALQLVVSERAKETKRLLILRDYLIKKVLQIIPESFLNGPKIGNKNLNRLPNNINIGFKGLEGESLVIYLDSKGICVSTGSACATESPEASHVLLAIGLNEKDAKASVRFTLGKTATKTDLDYVLKVLPELVRKLRQVTKL